MQVTAVSVNRVLDVLASRQAGPFAEVVRYPHIFGSEHAGVVDAVGPGCDSELIGRQVAVFPFIACGVCQCCREGSPCRCTSGQILGVHRDGAYASSVTVPVEAAVPFSGELDPVQVAAVALNGGVAAAQIEAAGLEAGQTLLVTGGNGGLGLTVAKLAQALGIDVTCAVRSEEAADRVRALDLSAVVVGDGMSLPTAQSREGGFAAVIDNVMQPELFQAGMRSLRPGGVLVTSGNLGSQQAVALDTRDLYLRSIGVAGVRTGSPGHLARYLRMMEGSDLELPIEVFSREAIERARGGLMSRPVLGRSVVRIAAY